MKKFLYYAFLFLFLHIASAQTNSQPFSGHAVFGRKLENSAVICAETTKQSGMITGYDGIKFGEKFKGVKQCIETNSAVVSKLESVYGKPYYRYFISRLSSEKKDTSEVCVRFDMHGRIYAFKDVFGGEWIWDAQKTEKKYMELLEGLIKKWGPPTQVAHDDFSIVETAWLHKDATATLAYFPALNKDALPVIRLTVAKNKSEN